MQEDENFSADRLVWDDAFREWVLAPTPETDARWQQWLRTHPDRRDEVERARKILLSITITEDQLSDSDLESIVQNTLVQARKSDPGSPRHRRLLPVVRYAAAVAFLAGLGWWFLSSGSMPSPLLPAGLYSETAVVTKYNRTGQPLEVSLPDGSLVVLQPSSFLRYAPAFGLALREVELVGEAFFDVRRDTARPFLVTTGDMVTKVLGTSFWVRSYPRAAEASIAVKTGRVAVFRRESYPAGNTGAEVSDSTILTPNQQVVFSRNAGSWRKSLVDSPEPIAQSAQSTRFQYDETPVSTAFRDLEAVYGIEIIFEEKLNRCHVTAAINGLPMYEQLRVLCKAIGARYTVSDGIIRIEGSACN